MALRGPPTHSEANEKHCRTQETNVSQKAKAVPNNSPKEVNLNFSQKYLENKPVNNRIITKRKEEDRLRRETEAKEEAAFEQFQDQFQDQFQEQFQEQFQPENMKEAEARKEYERMMK